MTSHILFSIIKLKISPTAIYYYIYIDYIWNVGKTICNIQIVRKSFFLSVHDRGQSEVIGSIDLPCHSRHCTVNIPPCSKAMGAEQILRLWSTSMLIVTSSSKWNFYECNIIRKQRLVWVLTEFPVFWALSTQPFFIFQSTTECFYVAKY